MVSNWAVYYMLQSDYAQYKMNIHYLYKEVLEIAKKEDGPREWHKYMELLEDIEALENKCKDIREEMSNFKNRI